MEQLSINHITKRFGRQTVLDDISFTLAPAKIYGLLGRNGVGKSTLLNIITNRIFPTSGTVKLGDQDANDNDDVLSRIFLMSETNLYPKRTSILRMFDLANEAYGQFNYQTAARQLKEFGLDEKQHLSNLSTGQQTIAKFVLALNVDADYILMDEPVLGLDAAHRDLFYQELLKSYQAKPRTFVLSTHLIEEVQQLLEHVIIIDQAKVVVDDDVQNLLERAHTVSGPADQVDKYTAGLRVLVSEDLGNIRTTYLLDDLDDQRVLPDTVELGHYDLQHLFIYLTNGGEVKNA
ncbi:ABC transporter ATP-binding protein [Limosilactobacillus pontis]|jgi:ABC-2 type transport system ATP-binding protein|uniref:ABC transporter ATP-binding protein n=1 Tax=Limosilactobacillus pontis TaxID=35787 RepID=A0ABT7UZC5_9LACO|nr:ABC transporter ATP-binding protein [Limosilactobacillus pontis]MDM8267051.1 ABC transporter ATP-binding protein [Limosilactobacillus pontis]